MKKYLCERCDKANNLVKLRKFNGGSVCSECYAYIADTCVMSAVPYTAWDELLGYDEDDPEDMYDLISSDEVSFVCPYCGSLEVIKDKGYNDIKDKFETEPVICSACSTAVTIGFFHGGSDTIIKTKVGDTCIALDGQDWIKVSLTGREGLFNNPTSIHSCIIPVKDFTQKAYKHLLN